MIIHMSLSYLLVHFVTLLFAGSDSSFDFYFLQAGQRSRSRSRGPAARGRGAGRGGGAMRSRSRWKEISHQLCFEETFGVIIDDPLYMKCMKSEGCLCYDYQQVHMTYL